MLLSVALCTYNGERFLAEQLASIAGQSRRPDELILCDDGSADATVALATQFAQSAPFPVHVEVNSANLGSTRNFDRAIRLCRGEIIALADQDDVWLPNKLATLERTLREKPAAGLAFSDADMVDPTLRPLGRRLWEAIEFSRREQRRFRAGQAFPLLLRRDRVTGATLAFRSRYKDLILPIPPEWIHDAWIALLIAAVAPLVQISEPLILYRQHPAQQVGERASGLVAQYRIARAMGEAGLRKVTARFAQALERLHGHPALSSDTIQALESKVQHAQARAAMRERNTWRLPLILREAWRGNYSRYSRGWKAIAQDLFLP